MQAHSADADAVAGSAQVPFSGFTLRHDEAARRVVIDIPVPLPGVRYVYPCRFGAVAGVVVDGPAAPVSGADVGLPSGTRRADITYA